MKGALSTKRSRRRALELLKNCFRSVFFLWCLAVNSRISSLSSMSRKLKTSSKTQSTSDSSENFSHVSVFTEFAGRPHTRERDASNYRDDVHVNATLTRIHVTAAMKKNPVRVMGERGEKRRREEGGRERESIYEREMREGEKERERKRERKRERDLTSREGGDVWWLIVNRFFKKVPSADGRRAATCNRRLRAVRAGRCTSRELSSS